MDAFEKEVLRYLGYRGSEADAGTLSNIRQLKAELKKIRSPSGIYGTWDILVNEAEVKLDGMTVYSSDLAARLKGCGKAVLMAATLGTEADGLIRRYSVSDMGKAVIAQAVCSALIEAYCDRLECEIAQKANESGLHPIRRFSPGYGDFGIEHQKDIIKLLNSAKRVGLTVSDDYMLIPSKSVTAVIGLSAQYQKRENKCSDCPDRQCYFRDVN